MFFLCLQVSPRLALYILVMAQEKRETRFCQARQTVGIAKHLPWNGSKKQYPTLVLYQVGVLSIDLKQK